jgi:RimJ/RimL family protein N-acetyltransferase
MNNTSPASSFIIPTIETARLLLRPFTADDLEDYTRRIFADVEVMRYLPRLLPDLSQAARNCHQILIDLRIVLP